MAAHQEVDEHLVLGESDFHYNRSSSPELMRLYAALKTAYQSADAILTTSGMHAIQTVLQTIGIMRRWEPINLVYGSELYTDSPRLFRYFETSFACFRLHPVDVLDVKGITNLFSTKLKNQDSILFIESCSNPNGSIFDLSMIETLKALSRSLLVVADNTWLSSAIFNPLQHGADIVVTSLTKYYSGGTAIGGAIMSDNIAFMKAADDYARITGIHVSPHNAHLIFTNMQSIHERIAASSANTLAVLEGIRSHERLLALRHPSLASHPSNGMAVKLFKRVQGNQQLFPSVFTFDVRSSKTQALKIMSRFAEIDHKTSFGASHTRTDPWPKSNEGVTTCRIAVGYADDADEVIAKIRALLDKF